MKQTRQLLIKSLQPNMAVMHHQMAKWHGSNKHTHEQATASTDNDYLIFYTVLTSQDLVWRMSGNYLCFH